VLADICLDLGLPPSHPIWLELKSAIMDNRGSPMDVIIAMIRRGRAWVAASPRARVSVPFVVPDNPPEWVWRTPTCAMDYWHRDPA
jgi:hypothetical protein